jgi:hypothetical protein
MMISGRHQGDQLEDMGGRLLGDNHQLQMPGREVKKRADFPSREIRPLKEIP